MMKTIYKSIIFTLSGLVLSLGVMAQNTNANDTTYNRQILLEKDFNPTLQDASKINTLPAIHEPVVKQADIQFETKQPNITFDSFPVGDTGSGDIHTSIDYSKKRGYLTFSGGNYLNLIGSLGYRVVDSQNDKLDFYARHNSTNGDVKYADDSYALDKAKAKYMNNLIRAKYAHSFEFLKWYLKGGFENTRFNYYGNPFGVALSNDFIDKQQTVNNFGIETGVASSDNNAFNYSGYLRYNYFSTKYGLTPDYDGLKGNLFDAEFDIAAPFGADKKVGVKLGAIYEGFSDIKAPVDKDDFHSLTNLKFSPYFGYQGDGFIAKLGINVNYAFDKKNKLALAPEVDFSWQFTDKSSFYINATGGINSNNYLSIIKENRYVSNQAKVKYSYTVADFLIGVKSGVVNGFEFDIFAGYRYTNDEHFYSSSVSWANLSRAYHYDLGIGQVGGLIKTSLIPYTDLSAKVTAYFYNIKYDGNNTTNPTEKKAWNQPSFTFNVNADVKPIDNFIFSASYYLATDRKAYFDMNESVSMKNINELNLRAEYSFFDWLSVNASVNNLLNQKYETWHGYTHQGMNFLGGVSLKF